MSHISIIDLGSRKTPLIAAMVNACGYAGEIIDWRACSEETLQHSDGLIFSGSPTMFTETDHSPYLDKFNFVTKGKVAVLGICFGHQLLGLIHGAEIFRGEEVRRLNTIRVMKKDPLFDDLFPVTEMMEDHTEGITLPPEFIHLAHSSSYNNESMRHPYLPLWGVQFHPEVSDLNGKKLIGNFLRCCKQK